MLKSLSLEVKIKKEKKVMIQTAGYLKSFPFCFNIRRCEVA
jgi:hypothetical protein